MNKITVFEDWAALGKARGFDGPHQVGALIEFTTPTGEQAGSWDGKEGWLKGSERQYHRTMPVQPV